MHDGAESTLIPFHGLLQRRSELATERFKQMTKAQIREFLFYVGAVMTWVESKGFSICDIGPSNLPVNPSSSFPPRLFLCDLQDWYQGGAQRKKGFSGLLRLAYQVCPEAEPALNKIWSSLRQHYPKRFAAFSAEAPAYRQLLQLQGCARFFQQWLLGRLPSLRPWSSGCHAQGAQAMPFATTPPWLPRI